MNLFKMDPKLRNLLSHMTTGKSRKVRDYYKKEKANTENQSKKNGLSVFWVWFLEVSLVTTSQSLFIIWVTQTITELLLMVILNPSLAMLSPRIFLLMSALLYHIPTMLTNQDSIQSMKPKETPQSMMWPLTLQQEVHLLLQVTSTPKFSKMVKHKLRYWLTEVLLLTIQVCMLSFLPQKWIIRKILESFQSVLVKSNSQPLTLTMLTFSHGYKT